MSPISAALCLFSVLAFVEVGFCRDCIHCDTQKDPKCGETFTSSAVAMTCGQDDSNTYKRLNLYPLLPNELFSGVVNDPQKCYKIVMESNTVVRSCLDGRDSTVVCNKAKELSKNDPLPGKRVKSCMACDKDGCNGAGALSFSFPLSVLTIFVSYLWYKQ